MKNIKNNKRCSKKVLTSEKNSSNAIKAIYLSGFLLATSSAFIAYINSSFLSTFIDEKYIGIIFTMGAFFTVVMLSKFSLILSKFGNFKTTITTLTLDILCLIGIATIKNSPIVIALFILHCSFQLLIYLNIDVFLEHFSKDKCTGSIRGTFLTIQNIAWVASPFIVGSILTDSNFWKIYLISASILVPILFSVIVSLKDNHDALYKHPPFFQAIKKLWANKNLYKIFMSRLLLQFFFAWMVIYMPIYLNKHIGFDWSQIGIIFTIMLLPYVIFEIPLGKIADSKLGEKEILSTGFVIMAIASIAISFITSTSVAIWATILFMTRVGGSFTDIMCETYFFKQIDDSDVDIICFYRNTKPFAYIISPLLATAFLYFFDFKYLFSFLGVIMLFGLKYSLTLKDTM